MCHSIHFRCRFQQINLPLGVNFMMVLASVYSLNQLSCSSQAAVMFNRFLLMLAYDLFNVYMYILFCIPITNSLRDVRLCVTCYSTSKISYLSGFPKPNTEILSYLDEVERFVYISSDFDLEPFQRYINKMLIVEYSPTVG